MGWKDFAIGVGTNAANTAANGIVGLGLNALGGIFGMSQKDMMELQHQYEIDKMNHQAELNREAADYSQGLAKEMWEYTGYANQVRQMKEANLSPSLIYGQTGGGGQSTSGGRQEGVSQGISQAVGMALEMKKIQAETNLMTAQAEKTKVEAEKTAGADTDKVYTEIDLMKDTMKTNVSLREMRYASAEEKRAKADEARQNILNMKETLKGIIINNEIKEETKEAEISKAITTSRNAVLEGFLIQSNIQLNGEEMRLFEQKANNFFYQCYTERMKANAQLKQADAANTSAEAAFLSAQGSIGHAANYEKWVQEFAEDVKSNKELREKLGNKLDNEIWMEWIKTGITSIGEIADLIFTKGLSGKVTETVKRTYDQSGEQTGETRTWSRKRDPIVVY